MVGGSVVGGSVVGGGVVVEHLALTTTDTSFAFAAAFGYSGSRVMRPSVTSHVDGLGAGRLAARRLEALDGPVVLDGEVLRTGVRRRVADGRR